MKIQLGVLLALAGIALHVHADTIVIRQPGLVESVGAAAVGTVRCVGEAACGLVAGSTTVINTPQYVGNTVVTVPQSVVAAPQTVVTVPACPVIQQPVVVTPTVVYPTVPVVTPVCPVVVPYGHYGRYRYGMPYHPCRPYPCHRYWHHW